MPEKPELVSLGDVWPRMGFSQLPGPLLDVLKTFLRRCGPDHDPPGQKPDAQSLYFDQVDRWNRVFVPAVTEDVAKRILAKTPVVPAYHRCSIAGISFKLGTNQHVTVAPTDIIWRWPYYQFAYTVVWALMFHEPNTVLAQPRYLFSQLLQVWERIYGNVQELDDQGERKQHVQWLALAVLERMCGIKHDIQQGAPHYLTNIKNRSWERVKLFQFAVDYLLERSCALLLTK